MCRRGVLSPLMECVSSTANLNPRNAAMHTHTHTQVHILTHPLFPPLTSLLTTCTVLCSCSKATLFHTLQTFFFPAAWMCFFFSPRRTVHAKRTQHSGEVGGLAFKCYLYSIMIFFSLSFVRVNLASVSIHYHPLTAHCQLRSSSLPILSKAEPVDFCYSSVVLL